jgi:hypothetical protein
MRYLAIVAVMAVLSLTIAPAIGAQQNREQIQAQTCVPTGDQIQEQQQQQQQQQEQICDPSRAQTQEQEQQQEQQQIQSRECQ